MEGGGGGEGGVGMAPWPPPSDYGPQRKGGKIYVKWKGHNNSFNSWIDKKASLCKMSYFLQAYSHNKNKIKYELH